MPPSAAPLRTAYRTHSLRIELLKNLAGLDEISFEGKSITGIFGPNCCGKSTILHALACCYQPPAGSTQPNYQFCQFFVPNTDALWAGSKLTICHSYSYQGAEYNAKEQTYTKNSTMWAPRYEKRPARHVSFLGIHTCIPAIETEKSKTRINYTATALDGELANHVRGKLGVVFNRQYDALNDLVATGNKRYRGVETGGLKYSSLFMGAGEQRMLLLLEEIFRSPKNGLILVDEIDLLLHGDALRRFLTIASQRANQKNLQIVFTSHRERLLDFDDLINIRHIHNDNGTTHCLCETKPDALYRLTGKRERPLELLVEDDLASTIVDKVAGGLGMRKYVKTVRFGAAKNAFTLLASTIIKDGNADRTLAVLDGDVFRTEDEKNAQIGPVLCGTGPGAAQQRAAALAATTDLNLPADEKPERFLHGMVIGLNEDHLDEEAKELVSLAKQIVMPVDKHDYVNKLIEDLGYAEDEKSAGLKQVVDLAAKSPQWCDYVRPVHEWLESKRHLVVAEAEPVAVATAGVEHE